jgi:uncharacterized hydrophobic protein (TIGR00271 family)
MLPDLIRDNRFTPEEIPKFERRLFFEGSRRRSYLERYGVLMFLATVIATMGIIGDSTATVIGAMIIAPLMTPIMATAAALLGGQRGRALRSTTIVFAGVAGVIALAWLLGRITSISLTFETHDQITNRTSPHLVDLVAALAAGAAGAFAMSRDDIADSLPGVAISVSLVPPLCVVGLALSAGKWDAAGGALLLFLTNYLSILLAGSGVLALLGLGRAATSDISKAARRRVYAAITVGVLIVTVPLAFTSYRLITQAQMKRQVGVALEAWVAETAFAVRAIEIEFFSERIDVTVSGSEESAPSFPQLVTNLETTLGTPVTVRLDIIPAQTLTHPEPVSNAPD